MKKITTKQFEFDNYFFQFLELCLLLSEKKYILHIYLYIYTYKDNIIHVYAFLILYNINGNLHTQLCLDLKKFE